MDLYNFFKSFLGIPNSVPPNDFNSERFKDYVQDGHDNLFRSDEEEESIGLNIFASPSEMQRYFEQQMNEVMRSFGLSAEGSFFDFFAGTDQQQIEAPPNGSPKSLRDEYLKPGFESPSTSTESKADSDVDGKVNLSDLDTMLQGGEQLPVTPYKRPIQSAYFGQSISTRTVLKPDGTVETHRTVRDSQGNEETSVSCRNGDKEYTVITRKDKDGKEEREEKLVGMDETEIASMSPVRTEDFSGGFNWFDINRFFKW